MDPFHALHPGQAAAGVYRLSDVAPDACCRSRHHEDCYRDTTQVDQIAFVIRPSEGVTLMLCLGRDAASGRGVRAGEWAACQAVAPVVVALAGRHWQGMSVPGNGAASGTGAMQVAMVAAGGKRRVTAAGRGGADDPARPLDPLDRAAAGRVAADG